MNRLMNTCVRRGSLNGRALSNFTPLTHHTSLITHHYPLILCSFTIMLCSACNSYPAPATVRKIGVDSGEQRRSASQTAPASSKSNEPSDVSSYSSAYGPAIHLADLEDQNVAESSGIASSRTSPNYFWTHNDSGDGAFIYAFDGRGRKRGVWQVKGAKARDWEDIAVGPGQLVSQQAEARRGSYLYVGDIGDNGQSRTQIVIYRFAEPAIAPGDAASTKAKPRTTEQAETIRLRYPDGRHDAEALLVHPISGDVYIVTKKAFARAAIYKAAAPLNPERTQTLERLGQLSIPSPLGGMITGGSISPDGRRVVLCDYGFAYEWIAPAGGSSRFDDVWKQQPTVLAVGPRQQGEAICYSADGEALLMTSEKLPTPLYKVQRKRR